MKRCDNHDENTKISLYPDYASSGIWCVKCGINLANPQKYFPKMSNDLIDAIDRWISLWDDINRSKNISEWWNDNIIIPTGKVLEGEISKNYSCEFDESFMYIIRFRNNIKG